MLQLADDPRRWRFEVCGNRVQTGPVDLPDIPTRIVLAPMAGGVGTPALVAAVGDAGGFGFLPSGYLGVERLHKDMEAVRALTHADFGVNVFVPAPPDTGRLQRAERYVDQLAGWSTKHEVPLVARPTPTTTTRPSWPCWPTSAPASSPSPSGSPGRRRCPPCTTPGLRCW